MRSGGAESRPASPPDPAVGGPIDRDDVRFLVEVYLSRLSAHEVPELDARVRAAAGQMTREGTPVRFVRSIFMPEDEICMWLFDAPSSDAASEASRRAKLALDRVVEVVSE